MLDFFLLALAAGTLWLVLSFAFAFGVAWAIRSGRGSPWRDDFDADLVKRKTRK